MAFHTVLCPTMVHRLFVAEFTQELYQLLGITLLATTAYYPWGDRQTEWVNQELDILDLYALSGAVSKNFGNSRLL